MSGSKPAYRGGSVTRLIRLLQSAEAEDRDDAAAKLWERYSSALLVRARECLDVRARARADEYDAAQEAFASFCLKHAQGGFKLDNRNQLWKLLVAMTVFKAITSNRHHRAGLRDYRREVATPTDVEGSGRADDWLLEQIASREPSGEEVVMLRDEFARLFCSLPDELRRVAIGRLEGRSTSEIAVSLGCTVRSVQRKWIRIQEHAQRIIEAEMETRGDEHT